MLHNDGIQFSYQDKHSHLDKKTVLTQNYESKNNYSPREY